MCFQLILSVESKKKRNAKKDLQVLKVGDRLRI